MTPGKISFAAGAIGTAGLPERVRAVAEVLAARHGSVHVSREKNGLHFNIACPECLDKEGDAELHKRHLAINADKACNTGKWEGRHGAAPDRVGMCMKCSKVFTLSKLQRWKTLDQRGIKASVVGHISVTDNTAWLVKDPNGNIIPGGPGVVTPVHMLPAGHVAVWYLNQRGFTNLAALYAQMRVSYCTEEWHADAAVGRFYRRIHFKSGPVFTDTPQHRLIFYCDMEGVQRAWQARILEHVDGDFKSYVHPGTGQWMVVEQRNAEGKFKVRPDLALDAKSYDAPSKYRTANGTQRNAVLFGYDAAVRWNQEARPGQAPVAFLVEGPLDACRIGAPGIAQIGKFLSDAQVELLAKRFSKVVLVPDNDKAGQEGKADALTRLSKRMAARVWDLPQAYKDVGDMPAAEVAHGVREQLLLI